MTTTIDVRLTVQRDNCISVLTILRKERNIQNAHVEDLLYQGINAEERRVIFSIVCRYDDTDILHRWQKKPPIVDEFINWLQSLRNYAEVEHIHALINGLPCEW